MNMYIGLVLAHPVASTSSHPMLARIAGINPQDSNDRRLLEDLAPLVAKVDASAGLELVASAYASKARSCNIPDSGVPAHLRRRIANRPEPAAWR